MVLTLCMCVCVRERGGGGGGGGDVDNRSVKTVAKYIKKCPQGNCCHGDLWD